MRKFKYIESYKLLSVEYKQGDFREEHCLVNLDIRFQLVRERGCFAPLFLDDSFTNSMGTPVRLLFEEMLKPYMDDNHIVSFTMLSDRSNIRSEVDTKKSEYHVSVFGWFEATFKDKRSYYLYKLRNGGPS